MCTAVKDSEMRAFGIGHWNRLAIAIGIGIGIRDREAIAIPMPIPKEYVELRNNDAYPAIIGQNHWGNGSAHTNERAKVTGM